MKRSAFVFTLLLAVAGAAEGAPGTQWLRSWAAAPQSATRPGQAQPAGRQFQDVTIRQIVRVSAGGTQARLRISNEMSGEALRLGAVRLALVGKDGSIVAGSERSVSFDGEGTTTIPPYAPIVSDPVPLAVPPLGRLAVSIHLPEGSPAPTMHATGRQTAWFAPGDQTGAAALADATTSISRYFLTGVDVSSPRRGSVIVAIGDSITDGAGAEMDRDARWPDVLAERLQRAGRRHFGVANAGISANRILSEGVGQNMLARLDRDVLSVPAVSHLIVLAGINDIGMAHRDKDPRPPSADDIIDSYRQLITRARDRGVSVIGATILPYKGAAYYSEEGEGVRQAVNQWIRTSGSFDGVIDFDRLMRDPADPARMKPGSHNGDFLHPSNAGYRAMGEAIDLSLFKSR
ncbi:MAG: SGNH/GDSL hydrolase family protein [Pseudomonadota bacterium]|nr:SGNH/GDSL hydrolase family protein [Pseudomonadota bacterium]